MGAASEVMLPFWCLASYQPAAVGEKSAIILTFNFPWVNFSAHKSAMITYLPASLYCAYAYSRTKATVVTAGIIRTSIKSRPHYRRLKGRDAVENLPHQ